MSEKQKENRKEKDNDKIGSERLQPKPQFIDIIKISVESLQDWRAGGRG